MRRMLGVLRGEDGQKMDLAPAPGLADIDLLVRNVRDAGVEVTVDRSGDADAVPAGVALTAFRIVQEALTNVLKHAGPARADVRIACDPGVIRIEVQDDGRGAAAPRDEAVNHLGLIGMRERVTPYGGDLDVGPRTGGGWRVGGTLPYEGVRA
jgi:signal transduction histidine kinase